MSVATRSAVENICLRIAQLDANSRQEIFERIEKMKTKQEISTPKLDGGNAFRISDLWGVGAEIWRDENVNEYIRKERDSWD